MSSPLNQITKKLDEIDEARDKALTGIWKISRAEDFPSQYGDNYKNCYGIEEGDDMAVCYPEGRLGESDAKFIALAANEIKSLTAALRTACETIQKLNKTVPYNGFKPDYLIESEEKLKEIANKLNGDL